MTEIDADPPQAPAPALCIGEAMVLLASADASLRIADAVDLHVAGAESNVAISLAQLGARVEWFGRLGADPFGRRILDALAARGVEAAVAPEHGARTGIYFKDSAGGGTQVLYYRDGSAASRMGPDDLAALRVPERRVCHLTGITPALSASCAALVDAILDTPGATVSFDVNYRPGLWSVDDAAPALLAAARRAGILFVGRDEAAVLWGTQDADDVRALLPEPAVLVVKDADIGATCWIGDDRVHVPAPAVDVVEPVGAGDAFAAGFLSEHLAGSDPATCLRTGHVMAARALRHRGDTPPTVPAERIRELARLDDDAWARLRFADAETLP
ncbi:sugar kinase [Microbacterium sp. gxy059]|uniref:sugar kinase n=1 Tax=Microbacterium sp. gxy059 TaxID=2957199 RepID=UPI003D98E16E